MDNVQYAPQINFKAWERICDAYFKKLGQTVPPYTIPVFIYGDAADLSNIHAIYGERFLTKIVSNPPHGIGIGKIITGMNEDFCYSLFTRHLKKLYELRLLTLNGKAYYMIPSFWIQHLLKENLPYDIAVLENHVEGNTLSIICLKQKIIDSKDALGLDTIHVHRQPRMDI